MKSSELGDFQEDVWKINEGIRGLKNKIILGSIDRWIILHRLSRVRCQKNHIYFCLLSDFLIKIVFKAVNVIHQTKVRRKRCRLRHSSIYPPIQPPIHPFIYLLIYLTRPLTIHTSNHRVVIPTSIYQQLLCAGYCSIFQRMK